MWDVIVQDGTGHTFGFSYVASSAAEAVAIFKQRARRAGIKKFRHIKIIQVERVR